MKNFLFPRYNQVSVVLLVVAILIAHFVAYINVSPLYDWRRNTISELAAQQYAYSWIMQSGFIVFGAVLIVGVIRKFLNRLAIWHVDIPIFLYASSVLLTGVFSVKPFFPVETYSQTHDKLHSFFATLSGVSISIGIFCHPFPLSGKSRRTVTFDFIVFAVVVALSAFFGLAESASASYVGIIQRSIWLFGLTWLALSYNNGLQGHTAGHQ
jgi:hypothetical membrane protein